MRWVYLNVFFLLQLVQFVLDEIVDEEEVSLKVLPLEGKIGNF